MLSDDAVVVRPVALGVCGTDREIISGEYGTAQPGQKRLILEYEEVYLRAYDNVSGARASIGRHLEFL